MGEQPVRIVVVGGVAGGASAATRARRLNEHARITVYEKDGYASFANCGLPYYIGGEIAERDKLIVAKPELFCDRFNIDLRTRHEVTAIDPERKLVRVHNRDTDDLFEEPYDKLILAPGASPVVPSIEGVDAEGVFTLRNLEDTDRIYESAVAGDAAHAVVVGAGFIGLEMVEQFVARAVSVTLVELQDQVLPLLDREMAQPLEQALRERGVDVRVGRKLGSIETDRGRVSAVGLDDGSRIATDLVVMGIGVRPSVHLAEVAGLALGASGGIAVDAFMRTSDPDVYAVGDAAEYVFGPTGAAMRVPLAGPANRSGRLAGQHAATGQAAAMAPVMGTSIVRVFDRAAGVTGLTAKAAGRLGVEAKSVTVIANHHVGYYPGAQPMTLKLTYAPDGRLLGLQAVGGAGVDKRLDVAATALAFNGTVYDLTGLDLAYAPPFGAAKDPIHMAAFTAANELDGLVDVCPTDKGLDGVQVIDVRTGDEVARAPIEGALHVPVDELRDRLGELDATKPTVVVCATGPRSYVAARVLMQHGFESVANLNGGYTVRRRVGSTEEHAR